MPRLEKILISFVLLLLATIFCQHTAVGMLNARDTFLNISGLVVVIVVFYAYYKLVQQLWKGN